MAFLLVQESNQYTFQHDNCKSITKEFVDIYEEVKELCPNGMRAEYLFFGARLALVGDNYEVSLRMRATK